MKRIRVLGILSAVLIVSMTGCGSAKTDSHMSSIIVEDTVVVGTSEESTELSTVGDRPTVGDIEVPGYEGDAIDVVETEVEEVETTVEQEIIEEDNTVDEESSYKEIGVSQVNSFAELAMEVSVDKWDRVCDIMSYNPDAVVIDGKEIRFSDLTEMSSAEVLAQLYKEFGFKKLRVNQEVISLLEESDFEVGSVEYFEELFYSIEEESRINIDLAWHPETELSILRITMEVDPVEYPTEMSLLVKSTNMRESVYLRFDNVATDVRLVDEKVNDNELLVTFDITTKECEDLE